MTLMRFNRPGLWNWNAPLRAELNRFFERPFAGLPTPSEFHRDWSPALDLYEEENAYVVKTELPGVKKENITIRFEDGVLTVAGETKEPDYAKDVQIHRNERFFGRFERTVSLAKPVESGQIKAQYVDGILTVTLPKAEAAKPKSIQVNVA